jgi:hypothetical protein
MHIQCSYPNDLHIHLFCLYINDSCSTIWYFESRPIDLEWKTIAVAQPEPSQNHDHRQANTQGDACKRTGPTSAEDIVDERSDLTEIDSEGGEAIEEEAHLGG